MKRTKKTLGIIGSIGVSTMLFLTGCSSTSQSTSSSSTSKTENITLAWWTNPDRTIETKKAVKMFEKKYPNIHVTMEYFPWSGYWSKMATEVAGGSEPDVMQMDGSRLNEYISKNRLMDLSKTSVDTSGISKNVVDLGKVDGKLYALTTAINAQALIYNPKILKQAGVSFPTGNYTWDDFAKLCETIHQKTGVYGIPDEMEQTGLLEYWARTHGEELYSKDGKSLGISKKTLTAWFQYWLDLQNKGGVPGAQTNASYDHTDTQSNPFVKGKAAFAWMFIGEGAQFENDLGSPITRAFLPDWGDSSKPYPLHPAMYWTISSQTQHADAAAKLVNFLENNPKVSQTFQNDRGIPANQANMKNNAKTTNDPTIKKQDAFMAKVEKVATTAPLEPSAASSATDLLKNISQQVTFKKMTPSQAEQQFRSQMNQALSLGD